MPWLSFWYRSAGYGSTSAGHGVAASISAKKRSRRVSFFLLAYPASEKLDCIGRFFVERSPYFDSYPPWAKAVAIKSALPQRRKKVWVFVIVQQVEPEMLLPTTR